MTDNRLRPFDPARLPMDGRAQRVSVEITEAAADHLAAWDLDQRVKAVHEAGHAVVGHALGLPIKAVDISGRHGGHTELGLDDDNLPDTATAGGTLDEIVMALAASAAERLILGQATMGAAEDLQRATSIAYARLNAGLGGAEAPFFSTGGVPFNLMPAAIVDEFGQAVVRTLADSRARADGLAATNRESILAFATVLYERRRLTGEELDALLKSLVLNASPTP